jgi:hypothetical protein
MSLDYLARLRASGQSPVMAVVTTDADVAEAYALNAGVWPILVQYGAEYDFSPLEGIPTVLALHEIQGSGPHAFASALQASGAIVTMFDLSTNSTSVAVYA